MKLDITLTVRSDDALDRIGESLAALHRKLDNQKEVMMAVSPQIQALADQLDAATNELEKDLKALRDTAAGRPLNADELAVFDAKLARLHALGADPENPVPPDPLPAQARRR